jgi:hypothetical protein
MQLSNPLRLEFVMRESYRRLAQPARDQENIACRPTDIKHVTVTEVISKSSASTSWPDERRDRDDPEDLGAERRREHGEQKQRNGRARAHQRLIETL